MEKEYNNLITPENITNKCCISPRAMVEAISLSLAEYTESMEKGVYNGSFKNEDMYKGAIIVLVSIIEAMDRLSKLKEGKE